MPKSNQKCSHFCSNLNSNSNKDVFQYMNLVNTTGNMSVLNTMSILKAWTYPQI